jgi:transcriptional regulator with XRE-family HTH domain
MDDQQLQHLRVQLGKRIQLLRESKGWSQDVFAHLVGMGRAYPHRIEKGKVDVQFTTLARMAHIFGLSLAELVTGIEFLNPLVESE